MRSKDCGLNPLMALRAILALGNTEGVALACLNRTSTTLVQVSNWFNDVSKKFPSSEIPTLRILYNPKMNECGSPSNSWQAWLNNQHRTQRKDRTLLDHSLPSVDAFLSSAVFELMPHNLKAFAIRFHTNSRETRVICESTNDREWTANGARFVWSATRTSLKMLVPEAASHVQLQHPNAQRLFATSMLECALKRHNSKDTNSATTSQPQSLPTLLLFCDGWLPLPDIELELPCLNADASWLAPLCRGEHWTSNATCALDWSTLRSIVAASASHLNASCIDLVCVGVALWHLASRDASNLSHVTIWKEYYATFEYQLQWSDATKNVLIHLCKEAAQQFDIYAKSSNASGATAPAPSFGDGIAALQQAHIKYSESLHMARLAHVYNHSRIVRIEKNLARIRRLMCDGLLKHSKMKVGDGDHASCIVVTCSICNERTSRSCSLCATTVYCSNTCELQDRERHRYHCQQAQTRSGQIITTSESVAIFATFFRQHPIARTLLDPFLRDCSKSKSTVVIIQGGNPSRDPLEVELAAARDVGLISSATFDLINTICKQCKSYERVVMLMQPSGFFEAVCLSLQPL